MVGNSVCRPITIASIFNTVAMMPCSYLHDFKYTCFLIVQNKNDFSWTCTVIIRSPDLVQRLRGRELKDVKKETDW